MEKNSRTEMLPGKWDFYRCCKARRSVSHLNKEFRQQRLGDRRKKKNKSGEDGSY